MREIETSRLRLRQFTPNDLDDLYRLYSNPDLTRFIGKGARTKKETQTALSAIIKHYEHGFGMWAVIHKADDKLIGRCGLCFLDNTPEVELGYLLDKFYWCRGLATEASHASLKYGFELVKLEKIVAIARPENIASRRVMAKVGMKYEKDVCFYNLNAVYYAISRDDYQTSG
jgi:RimJ/RimL family protein N-acetyltransferase